MTPTIRVDIWDKLLRNLSTSPICALTGEPIAVLGRHPELFALAKGLMREGLAVCSAYGIHIDLDPERAYGARPTSTHKSSMLQDFERHRPPEIDGLLTAVQEFARAARIATPQLDAITALIIQKARRMGGGWVSTRSTADPARRSFSRGLPLAQPVPTMSIQDPSKERTDVYRGKVPVQAHGRRRHVEPRLV